ncbi:MAG: insulinase family protein, partial [Alphaproteobacteria bacterium]|nr:insulinase family protein [Alphaproteobacteria bacterium]
MTPRRRLALAAGVAIALLALLAWWWSRPVAADAPGELAEDAGPRAIRTLDAGFVRELPSDREAIPRPIFAPGQPHPFQAEPWVLDNGLTVIVVPDRSAHTVATRIVVRAGSSDDPRGLEGTAHFLEHLMFAGTSQLGTVDFEAEAPHLDAVAELSSQLARTEDEDEHKEIDQWLQEEERRAAAWGRPGELARLYDELGITDLNAWTSHDGTVFQSTVPISVLEPWAEAETLRFTDPALRRFSRERQVVQEEVLFRSGCSTSTVADAQREALYGPSHRLSRAIGGTQESLEAIAVDDVHGFFDRWYVPRNMALILVGDVELSTLLPLLERTFGQLPDRRLQTRPSPVYASPVAGIHPVPTAERYRRRIAWRIDRTDPADLAALGVIIAAVDLEGKWTIEPHGDTAVLALDTFGKDDDQLVQETREAIDRALGRSPRTLPLESARYKAWVRRLRELEDPRRQAEEIAQGWLFGRGPEVLMSTLRALFELDEQEIATRVAQIWRPDDLAYTSGEARRPQLPPRSPWRVSPEERDQPFSAAANRLLMLPRPDQPPGYREAGEEVWWSDDRRVVLVRNPSNTLFEAHLTWPVGWADAPNRCLALHLWRSSQAAQDTRFARLNRSAVETRVRCEHDRTTIEVLGPGEMASEALLTIGLSLRSPRLVRPSAIARMHAAEEAQPDRGRVSLLLDEPPPALTLTAMMNGAESVLAGLTEDLSVYGVAPDIRITGPFTLREALGMWPGDRPRGPEPLVAERAVPPQVRTTDGGELAVL